MSVRTSDLPHFQNRLLRRHLRIPVLMATDGGRQIRGMTFDISTGGIRLQSKQALSEGEQGVVEMILPSEETVRATASVVWKKPGSAGVTDYGLRFGFLGASELSAIFQAVNLRAYVAV